MKGAPRILSALPIVLSAALAAAAEYSVEAVRYGTIPQYPLSGLVVGAPGGEKGNLEALDRMIDLAGARERVVPGHDPLIFSRFPSKGRIARIR